MELEGKFRIVAAVNSIIRPYYVEGDRPYPILGISKSTPYPNGVPLVILTIQSDDGEQQTVLLNTAYAVVVGDIDVDKINAEPGRFKLTYRRKAGCENCYLISINP
jgi:hypothetical protein